MRESTIEKHLVAKVKAMGGMAYKFTSPAHRGVADRVVCLPDGSTWFVELKAPGGRLSELQKIFLCYAGGSTTTGEYSGQRQLPRVRRRNSKN